MGKKKREFVLKGYHYRAIHLRFQGEIYENIAKILAEEFKRPFTGVHIRNWFMSNGLLEKHYLDFANKEVDRMKKKTMTEMGKLLGQLPKKYDQMLNNRKYRNGEDKLDAVTRGVLRDIAELFGFKLVRDDGSDIFDEMMDKIENKTNNDQGADNQDIP